MFCRHGEETIKEMKLSQVHKITLSALLLVLTIILTRITPLQDFPVIPWIRISLGPSLIIFSSLLLGPLYGAIVGAGSDILGIVLFPNKLGYGINPLFTLVYGLLGVLPWILLYLVKRIKNEEILRFLFIIISVLIGIAIELFIFFVPQIQSGYDFKAGIKIAIIVVSSVLMIVDIILIHLFNMFFRKKYGQVFSPFKIAFVCLISELVLMLFLNSLVKTITFEVNYWIIFFAQLLVFFIDVPLNTFVCEFLILLVARIKGQSLVE